MQKGEIIKIEIDNLAHDGRGVGHLDNTYAVFVRGAIPTEKVRAKITRKKKNYLEADLLEILSPAKERLKPECPVYELCGGCQLQHMNYEAQLRYKKEIIINNLRRIGGLETINFKGIRASDYPWSYRNKAQFPLTVDDEGTIKAGFYQRGTHRVVINDECKIQHPLINRILRLTLDKLSAHEFSVYDENSARGLLRHLVIRAGTCTNQGLLIMVTNGEYNSELKLIADELIKEINELKGVVQNVNKEKTNVILGDTFINLSGQGHIIDYIGNIKFKISADTFFQVNTLQAEKLYNIILKYAELKGHEKIVDAYCGIGSIALYLANNAVFIYGIENNKNSIIKAEENASLNNIDNTKYFNGKVEDVLPDIFEANESPDIIVFDPPRKGLDESIILELFKISPKKIIYVSCNPSTLARDIKRLKEIYKIIEVQAVDMFPQTYHVETVCLLERNN